MPYNFNKIDHQFRFNERLNSKFFFTKKFTVYKEFFMNRITDARLTYISKIKQIDARIGKI